MSDIYITGDDVKSHLKKHRTKYIAAASLTVGLVAGVILTRRFGMPSYSNIYSGIAGTFQIGGEKSPIKLAMTLNEARGYNRIAEKIAQMPRGKKHFIVADTKDMKIFNMVGEVINEYIAKNGPISEEQFDINQALLVQIK